VFANIVYSPGSYEMATARQ